MLKDQQYNHLTSNTPMKLLTTIAAVLISISAYSQDEAYWAVIDYVEYDNGTFTQNGEQLSMEQIYDLTVLHKAGRGNVRRGNRFDRMHKNRNLRFKNNGLNALGGAASGFVGVVFFVAGGEEAYWAVIDRDGELLGYITSNLGLGTGFCAVSYKAFSRIALSPAGCLWKKQKEFHKVADKLNEVIKAANQ